MTNINCSIYFQRARTLVLFPFWLCLKILLFLKTRKIWAKISVVAVRALRRRKAGERQLPWQQWNFFFSCWKMCRLHHQMCQRLVAMTTAMWMGKCSSWDLVLEAHWVIVDENPCQIKNFLQCVLFKKECRVKPRNPVCLIVSEDVTFLNTIISEAFLDWQIIILAVFFK